MVDELVTVGRFANSVEANLARNRLADAGIRAVLFDDYAVDMAWHLGNAMGGVKLSVPAEQAEAAQAVLARPPDRETETEPRGAYPPAGPDEPEEPPPNRREQNAARVARAAVIGLLFPPLEFYAFWLLGKVFLSDEPLTEPRRRLVWLAALVNLPYMACLCYFIGWLFF